MKNKLSRRDFIKLTLLGVGAGFLAACKRVVTPAINAVATFTATPSKTNTPRPTETNTPTSTPTETPTPTEIPCFRLLLPENGAKLPAVGKITFSWESMLGAISYQIQFTLPSGQVLSFDVESTSNTRYIESFIAGGVYSWQVIALDNDGIVICTAEAFRFEKPAYAPPQNNGSGGNDSGSDSGSDGSGGPSGADGSGSDGF